MFLIDRDHMGHLTSQVLDMKLIRGVIGGQSYYLNNIVASGGTTINVFSVNTMPSPSLTFIHSSPTWPPPSALASTSLTAGSRPSAFVGSNGDNGFFTSISSNGQADAIIWAVTRVALTSPPGPVSLVAFRPVPGTIELKQLFQSIAGTWDGLDNSKIVPVVANGRVYVASNKELDSFGFPTPASKP